MASRLIDRDSAAGDALGQGLALGELHDEEVKGPRGLVAGCGELSGLEGVDRSDLGMVECSQHSGLALEASQPLGVGG